MEEVLKKGKVQQDLKKAEQDKRSVELLSSTLKDVQERFKATESDMEDKIQSVDELFDDYKKKYEDSLNFNIPEIMPLGTVVITSCKLLNIMDYAKELIGQEFNAETVNDLKNAVGEKQIVLAVGPHVRQVKVGDEVQIRLSDFFQVQNPNSVNRKEISIIPEKWINGERYLSIHENNIDWVMKDKGFYDRRKDSEKASS